MSSIKQNTKILNNEGQKSTPIPAKPCCLKIVLDSCQVIAHQKFLTSLCSCIYAD